MALVTADETQGRAGRRLPKQAHLDWEGIVHLSGTRFPSESVSNTYIAGHAAATAQASSPTSSATSKTSGGGYHHPSQRERPTNYRVYKRLVPNPRDIQATKAMLGEDIISLQTCFIAPTFENRLIFRGELAS